MQHNDYVAAIENHTTGLREGARTAGPDAPVPTCPRWTVRRLVGHLGRVQSWVVSAIEHPDGEGVTRATPPEDWDELLDWSATQQTELIAALAVGPDRPAWLASFPAEGTTGSWARRQAHEAAIHRLDAEHAVGEPSVRFDQDLATDGVDEFLTMVLLRQHDWSESTASGTVLIETTDTGRRWVAVAAPSVAPTVQRDAGVRSADLTISGDADAVYRALWGRPHGAAITGNTTLLEPLRAP